MPALNTDVFIIPSEYDWLHFCGGNLAANNDGGDMYIMVTEGACLSQGLSASDVTAMQGKVFDYSCDIDLYSDSYASILLSLDGVEHTKVVPPNSSSNVLITVLGPESISNGYVGIYSEAPSGGMRLYNCELEPVEDGTGETSVVPENNLLINGSFDDRDADNKPQGWGLGCNGTWESIESPHSEAALEISATMGFACFEQTLNTDEVGLLSENTYTIACDAWNYGQGWGLLLIRAGDTAAATGNVSGFSSIESDQAVCAKTYDPRLGVGQYDVYECVVQNVTSNMTVTVSATSGGGAYNANLSDTASVVVE